MLQNSVCYKTVCVTKQTIVVTTWRSWRCHSSSYQLLHSCWHYDAADSRLLLLHVVVDSCDRSCWDSCGRRCRSGNHAERYCDVIRSLVNSHSAIVRVGGSAH